jgi:hypothetical protein
VRRTLIALLAAGAIVGWRQAPGISEPAAAPPFTSRVQPIAREARTRMLNRSWQPGCPVSPDDLASLTLSYWGVDSRAHTGTLVIHKNLASETVAIFRELYAARFPINAMVPYETYPIGQYATENDTVGFYCRPAQDDPAHWSSHAYGYAIDINPRVNPFRDPKDGWWPAGSAAASARDRTRPGTIAPGTSVFAAFTRHGWTWGGFARHLDYMHFTKGTAGSGTSPMTDQYVITGLRYQPR